MPSKNSRNQKKWNGNGKSEAARNVADSTRIGNKIPNENDGSKIGISCKSFSSVNDYNSSIPRANDGSKVASSWKSSWPMQNAHTSSNQAENDCSIQRANDGSKVASSLKSSWPMKNSTQADNNCSIQQASNSSKGEFSFSKRGNESAPIQKENSGIVSSIQGKASIRAIITEIMPI